MTSWLWKILFVCLILGGAQWLHAHPDSPASQQVLAFFHAVQVEWTLFLQHFSEILQKFPGYMHDMLDTVPKPIIETPKKS